MFHVEHFAELGCLQIFVPAIKGCLRSAPPRYGCKERTRTWGTYGVIIFGSWIGLTSKMFHVEHFVGIGAVGDARQVSQERPKLRLGTRLQEIYPTFNLN